ncbi:hypothetical protein Taro_011608, partial [Colocasia esculenta]|nr:hypothetical protein [Colocasia esculenta]
GLHEAVKPCWILASTPSHSSSIHSSSLESGAIVSFHSTHEAEASSSSPLSSNRQWHVIKRGKRPLPRPGMFVVEERTHIIPRAISPLKGFELPHLALHQAAVAFTINYLHLLYVIPLEHTKDLMALRNLGFEFPSINNNDYPRGSLAARIGRYAWHISPILSRCFPFVSNVVQAWIDQRGQVAGARAAPRPVGVSGGSTSRS